MATSSSADDALARFEPGLREWFATAVGTPTEVQAAAWPAIAGGEHVLVTAPTGSGKTLTAFLWALNRFAAGDSEPGTTRVLYVSPLKALNNDIQRNLLAPLAELSERGAVPHVRVQTRSGDTPQSERQRMLRRPPEILITTPESLTLLLTSTRGRHALTGVETVIIDEVHALTDNRRGTLVFTGLERLVELAGDFQRIALSATVRPLDAVAAHVAGYDPGGAPRPIRIVASAQDKQISLGVRFPAGAQAAMDGGQKIWEVLAAPFRDIIQTNRATLFFANSRRLAERLTLAINRDQGDPLAYAHHGSLSREIRLDVEARLKRGDLRAIVATSSLEMGIDIGALDEVVMVQSPPTIAATLQRIGRAGHRVGEVSRAVLFPTYAQDFVQAAALAAAVADRDIEPITPLENPLDVLAQLVVSLSASESWPVEDIYALLRRSAPYHRLPRPQFDLVIEMLAGRYAGSRVRELKARIAYDRIRGEVKAQHAAVLALYNSGGVIPDRGYFQLRHAGSGAVIGELDEEFVWEATIGQVFTLGNQNWQIQRVTHNDVLVQPTASPATTPPFWRAESTSRSFHYSRRIGTFLRDAEARLAAGDAAGLREALCTRGGFDDTAAAALVDHLERQRDAVEAPLPHLDHVLAERVKTGPGGYRGPDDPEQLVLHTFWGGRVNRPWALALGAALGRQGVNAELHADDDAVAIQTREVLDLPWLLRLVTPANLETLLRASLESSGLFGARFREAAGRALLQSRQRFNTRLPLWMSRLQAKKLMSAVAEFSDFPILLEAWRSCLNDEFDLPALEQCLSALEDGALAVSSRTTATPSPFAANLAFVQINRYMYADDTPERGGASSLSDELIRSAVYDAELRPRLEGATVAAFLAKRQRTAAGYEPDSADDWAEWIKERILLPETEVPAALVHPDLVWISQDHRRWLTHRELLAVLQSSGLAAKSRMPPPPEVDDIRSATELALEILSFYGPLTEAQVAALLPSVPPGLLDDEETLVRGVLLAGEDGIYYCDPANFEAMLRLQRALRRPVLDPRPATDLPVWLAAWQGLAPGDAVPDVASGLAVEQALEPLRGYRAPVGVWLFDLPAARLPGLKDHQLDEAFATLGLAWRGAGRGQMRLGYPEDLALLTDGEHSAGVSELFADPDARYGFLTLAERQGEPLASFNDRWWQAVWAGEVSADSLTPLRQGALRDFSLGGPSTPSWQRAARSRSGSQNRRSRAPRFSRSAYADPWSGNWLLLAETEPPADSLVALEDDRERARMLLDRYGLVCRELVTREGSPLRWRAVFRAMRLMELAGEVVAGYFFSGLSGPQFVPPSALAALAAEPAAPADFWCNALDPASPCGLGLDWPELPQRRPHNYLSFHAGRLATVVENGGKRLTFHLPPDHPSLGTALAPVARLLVRQRRLTLLEINGAAPAGSPYLPALEALGRVVSDHRATYLETSTLQA